MGYQDRRGHHCIRGVPRYQRGIKIEKGINVSDVVPRWQNGIKIKKGIKLSYEVSRYQRGLAIESRCQCVSWYQMWYQDGRVYQGIRWVPWHQMGIMIEEWIKVSYGVSI